MRWLGVAVVANLRDLTMAAGFCDAVLLLSRGAALAFGAPAAALSEPLIARAFALTARSETLAPSGRTSPSSSNPDPPSRERPAILAIPAAAQEGFPVTVRRCDREVTFDAPPERAICDDVNLTEMMLVLRLLDRMVGRPGISGWNEIISLKKSLLRHGKSPDSLGSGGRGGSGDDGRADGAGDAVPRLRP